MAIGTITDMVVFNEQFYGAFIETIQDNVDVFNESSFNMLQLRTQFHVGLRKEEAFMSRSNGRFRRTLGSVANHTPANLPSDSVKKVKLFDAVHYEQTLQSYKTQGLSVDEIAFNAGVQSAGDIAESWRDTSLSSLQGAYSLAGLITGPDQLVQDVTAVGNGVLDSAGLIAGMPLFGDRTQKIRGYIMRSEVYWKLVGAQEASPTADGIADVVVMTGTPATLGKPVIVVDSPALIDAGAGPSGADVYLSYALVENAVTVEESEQPSSLFELVGGKENLIQRVQSEYAFTVGLKGIDYAAATDNPSDAVLATDTSWAKKYDSKKDLPGIQYRSLV